MSTSDPGFQLAITRWLADHRAEPSSVHIVEIAGHRCVIKLRRPKLTDVIVNATHYLRAGMLSLICWWTLGERPSVAVLMRTSLDDEASRLEFLTRQGCRVPTVWRHEPGVLVLEYVGQDMPYLIRIDTPASRLIWMDRAAQDLAVFHRAGFVHGV